MGFLRQGKLAGFFCLGAVGPAFDELAIEESQLPEPEARCSGSRPCGRPEGSLAGGTGSGLRPAVSRFSVWLLLPLMSCWKLLPHDPPAREGCCCGSSARTAMSENEGVESLGSGLSAGAGASCGLARGKREDHEAEDVALPGAAVGAAPAWVDLSGMSRRKSRCTAAAQAWAVARPGCVEKEPLGRWPSAAGGRGGLWSARVPLAERLALFVSECLAMMKKGCCWASPALTRFVGSGCKSIMIISLQSLLIARKSGLAERSTWPRCVLRKVEAMFGPSKGERPQMR